MKKHQLIFCLLFVLFWVFCSASWAKEEKGTFPQELERIQKLYNLAKEGKIISPSDLKETKKPQTLGKYESADGAISGLVTKSGGGNLAGVTVRAGSLRCPYHSNYDVTAGDGTYTITGLPPGWYEVWTDNDSDFVDVYYDNKTFQDADSVWVSSGATTTDIDFSLRVGGKITGKLTLTGSSFVISVFIFAYNASTMETFIDIPISYTTDTVTYVIRRLPTGDYKLKTYNMTGFIDGHGYIDEYYNDRASLATADLVSVTEGSTTSGKDITLVQGGIIEGTITSAGKVPLEDIEVLGYHVDYPTDWIIMGFSDEDGDYSLYGLRSGDWKILALGDTTYEWEWYDDESSWNIANNVSVSGTNTVTGKDFTLSIGGSISGYVYDLGSSPLQDCDVAAYETSFVYGGIPVKWDETSETGSYKITGLRSGGYKVQASDECSEQWYYHATSYLTADIVSVIQPGNTSGIDFNLPSAVEDEEEVVSKIAEFKLCQNYPNPFNPGTEIEYALNKPGEVTLEVYNLIGQKIKTLVKERQPAGSHRVVWDGRNEQGKPVSSGIYFYRLGVNGGTETKRMVLLK